MKMNRLRRLTVNFSLGNRDSLKDGGGFGFDPIRECAVANQFFDFGKSATVLVFMVMIVFVVVAMFIFLIVMMPMLMSVRVVVIFVLMVRKMNVELHAFDARFFLAPRVKMIPIQFKLSQFSLQLSEVHTKIQHRSNEHVAADPAENIEINRVHFSSPAASALIWLAAKAAPKPLLMFTTVKPLLQLLSIASNAVKPPRCAP